MVTGSRGEGEGSKAQDIVFSLLGCCGSISVDADRIDPFGKTA